MSRRWSRRWSAWGRRRARSAIKGLTSLLEPVMIIFVGAMVGFIVISMYMPLFKVYDAIR